MPEPIEDGCKCNPLSYEVVGCTNINHIRYWFKPIMARELERAGFELVRYSVPKAYVDEGNTQAVFKQSEGELIEVVKYDDLVEEIKRGRSGRRG